MSIMATIKFKNARIRVEFATNDAVPLAASSELPVRSIKTANAQPDDNLRRTIVLGIERTLSGQFVIYRGPDLPTLLANAIPRGMRLEIKLRMGNKVVTNAAFFPILEGNDIATTDAAFLAAPLMIYVVKDSGTLTLFSVVPPGPGGGDPCAGCDAPADDAARYLFALVGCYS
jgi:hypothetical protein